MMWYIVALVAILAGSRAQQEVNKKQEQQQQQPQQQSPATVQQPAPLSYYGGFQGQLPLQYDVRFLEPQQVQLPANLGFAPEKQIFPRYASEDIKRKLFYYVNLLLVTGYSRRCCSTQAALLRASNSCCSQEHHPATSWYRNRNQVPKLSWGMPHLDLCSLLDILSPHMFPRSKRTPKKSPPIRPKSPNFQVSANYRISNHYLCFWSFPQSATVTTKI